MKAGCKNVHIYLFCWPTYRSNRPADFHERWLEQSGLTQGSNRFWNRNSKLISNPRKIPQSRKLGPKRTNFWPKMLLYKKFHLYTAPNRHRRPIKVVYWIDNMASGIPNMWSFWTPCLQVVIRSMRSELLAFNMGKCNFESLYFRNGAR